MKKLLKNVQAVSPIVASLMLILVAVGAASSFAIFVGERQGAIQEARNKELKKDLEKLEIMGLTDIDFDMNSTDYNKSLGIKIRNIHPDTSIIHSMYLNGEEIEKFYLEKDNLKKWYWLNVSSGFYEPMKVEESDNGIDYYNVHDITKSKSSGFLNNRSGIFNIRSYQSLTIYVNNTNATCNFYHKGLKYDFDVNNSFLTEFEYDLPITVKVTTSYVNDFEKTFYPPSAIISVTTEQQWNSSATPPQYEPYVILDGSKSDHPGDGYIIRWAWDVEGSKDYGRKIRFDNFKSGLNNVTLTVTDNNGMKGIDTVKYYK